MTSFAPILRFIVYAGETGSTVLQAPATAPHQDFFRVASRTGLSGYAPYLYAEPQIDGQSLTLPDFTSTVGSCKIQIGDFRTGVSQFERWATAFIGRTSEENLLVGRRCLLDVSYDGGTTYEAVYAGRIARAEMQDILLMLEVRDIGFDLKQDVMTGIDPSLTYAAQTTLYPVGLSRSLPGSGFAGVIPANGTISSTIAGAQLTTFDINGNSFFASANGGFEITVDSRNATFLTSTQKDALTNAIQTRTTYYSGSVNGDRGGIYTTALLYAVNSTRGNAGYLTVLDVQTSPQSNTSELHRVISFKTQILPATFSSVGRITAASGWQRNDKLTLYVVKLGEPTTENRVFINPPDITTYVRDMIQGRFSFTPTTGTQRLFIYTGSASFTDLNTNGYPFELRFSVDKKDTFDNYFRESIAKPYQVGYRSDIAAIDGTSGSVFSVFSAARPSVAPSIILNEDDIIAGTDVAWLNDPSFSEVVVVRHADNKLPKGPVNTTDIADSRLSKVGASLFGNELRIDGNTLRFSANTSQSVAVANYANSLLSTLDEQFGRGKLTVRVDVRRNAKTIALKVGTWVLVDSVTVPNPSTQRRGGQRLMIVTSISPTLSTFSLELLDAGISTATAQPTFVTASYSASLPNTVVAQWSASTAVEVQYAVHPDGVGSVPANSGLWSFIGKTTTIDEKAVRISPLPAAKTVTVRVRGISPNGGVLQLPSSWVDATPVTLPALAPVTSLSVSGITTGQAIFSWQTGSSQPIELLIRSPNSNPFTASLITLPAGSTRYVMQGVETYPNTSMGIGVRHIDAFGSTSTITSASWTATGAATALPSMSFFYTYLG